METKKKKVTKKTPKLTIGVQQLRESGIMPTRTHKNDAGFDLYASRKRIVSGQSKAKINTDIALNIPKGYFCKVFDRSGVAVDTGLLVKAGVIDSDYTGEIGVILCNTSLYPETVLAGDRIAQFVVLPVPEVELKRIINNKATDRGNNGFGSSGR